MNEYKIIGLSGCATVGKDFFYSILESMHPSRRFSLGDILKNEMRQKLQEETGIDIFNCSAEQKEKVRPKLIEYGGRKRRETKGRYFTGILTSYIINTFTMGQIPVITDIRYAQYDKDELSWLKKELGGVLVHIEKHSIVGGEKKYVEPPNEDEKINTPILKKNADYIIDWPEAKGDFYKKQEVLKPHVEKFIDWYSKLE
jgi:hypothetical protein